MPAPSLLYLDTARLGQMSELAQRLSISFIRLSAEEPFSLYFEQFLRDGFKSWPADYQRRFPQLSGWKGIGSLAEGIRNVAGACDDAAIAIASRSLWLVQCAARKAFEKCNRILTTDLSWPSYQSVFEGEAARTGRELYCLKIRHRILHESLCERDLIDQLAAFYWKHHCDGLFLPAVDSYGIRLPVAAIASTIETRAELEFVVIDAAQAFGQIQLGDVCKVSDLVIAGCHKWLRAYHPMGIGILGSRRYRSEIWNSLVAHQGEDPLFQFLSCLRADGLAGHMETVNLTPLLSCQGAIDDHVVTNLTTRSRHQRCNAWLVQGMLRDSEWRPLYVDESMQCGIQLLVSPSDVELTCLERQIQDAGVRMTILPSGLVRTSLPVELLSADETKMLHSALLGSSEFEGYPRVVQ